VKSLSDSVVQHLREVADWPDFSATSYSIVRKIGQGGMGTVYLAQDQKLDRPVALKVLSAGLVAADFQERLAREAKVLARLEHPGIVPIHDFGNLPDGRAFYAMKLARGGRLDELVKNERPLPEVLRDFEKICQAVAFAHANGVIHRDLKPQNIMVGAFGELLVMDWGVAKIIADSTVQKSNEPSSIPTVAAGKTLDGAVIGTPGYMAPEQAWGELGKIDERTDIYSLGAILYFLLTGQAPRPVPGRDELASLIPPRRIKPKIPRPLEAICLKALAIERSVRYPNVESFGADIAAFMSHQRVAAYPEGIFGASRRFVSKYGTAISLILAYLVMRVLLMFWDQF